MVTLILPRLAPLGAFGAMAFTIGKYGLGSLLPLLKLIGTFYLTSILDRGRGDGHECDRAGGGLLHPALPWPTSRRSC